MKFSLHESLTFFLSFSLSREKLRKNLAVMRMKHSEWGNNSGDEMHRAADGVSIGS
jgi:hypothetical protein